MEPLLERGKQRRKDNACANPVYTRIRASLCPIHGLGGISGRRDERRDNEALLDEYAAQITALVLKAKSARRVA